ncbi:hypothetical protein [Pseudomonas sp. PGPR40]|uniref:hypothetical protein n=1 Tax=Pseudomonas sp. PGPR40 TaxID=2913476 RepID=UPI001EDAC3E0|nr:hypothetical protein [Pseudomonas sp. PGPR40]
MIDLVNLNLAPARSNMHFGLVGITSKRGCRNAIASNLSFTAKFDIHKPLISREVRGFVVSGVWIFSIMAAAGSGASAKARPKMM